MDRAPDFELVGRFIFEFHRLFGSVDALTGIELTTQAPQELGLRTARLTQQYKYIMANFATVTATEIAETLDEAAKVQGLIK
jgi:hypothetical protein